MACLQCGRMPGSGKIAEWSAGTNAYAGLHVSCAARTSKQAMIGQFVQPSKHSARPGSWQPQADCLMQDRSDNALSISSQSWPEGNLSYCPTAYLHANTRLSETTSGNVAHYHSFLPNFHISFSSNWISAPIPDRFPTTGFSGLAAIGIR